MNREMLNAYRVAQLILEHEQSEDERSLLAAATESEVIVVQAIYDRVEDVLKLAAIPHTLVLPSAMAILRRELEQLLIVNVGPSKLRS